MVAPQKATFPAPRNQLGFQDWWCNSSHQEGMNSSITHIMGLSRESRAGAQASPQWLQRREEQVLLVFIRLWGWSQYFHGGAGSWMFLQISLLASKKKVGFPISLPSCGARGKGRRVRLKHCQQSNIQNGVKTLNYNSPLMFTRWLECAMFHLVEFVLV